MKTKEEILEEISALENDMFFIVFNCLFPVDAVMALGMPEEHEAETLQEYNEILNQTHTLKWVLGDIESLDPPMK